MNAALMMGGADGGPAVPAFKPTDITGFLAEWPFDDGAGTTLRDISGHAFNGTLQLYNTTPTWSAQGLSFNDAHDYVTIPTGSVLGMDTMMIACDLGPVYDLQYNTIRWTIGSVLAAVTNVNCALGFDLVDSRPIVWDSGPSPNMKFGSSWPIRSGSIGTIIWQLSTGKIWVNGAPVANYWSAGTSYANSFTTVAAAVLGGYPTELSSPSHQGKYYYAMTWTGGPSGDAQALGMHNYAKAKLAARGVAVSTGDIQALRSVFIVTMGDSIARLLGEAIAPLLANKALYTFSNVSIGGTGVGQMTSGLAQNLSALLAGYAGSCYVVFHMGTNDSWTTYAGFKALAAACKTAGATKVLTDTGLSRTPGTNEAARLTWNSTQRAESSPAYDYIPDVGGVAGTGLGPQCVINNVALLSNVVTLTTASAHGFVAGRSIYVQGLSHTVLNGNWIMASASGVLITYNLVNANIISVADSGLGFQGLGDGVHPDVNGQDVCAAMIVAGLNSFGVT